ncbi:Uncharacterised protein [Corynebacterium jeikeium]|nr:Uncharacterised protein [Corynebacterium jeikeium]
MAAAVSRSTETATISLCSAATARITTAPTTALKMMSELDTPVIEPKRKLFRLAV